MLPWLHKKLSRKTLFFCELVTVSIALHCVLGLALFVLYRGQFESFSFEVRSKINCSDQPVLFVAHKGLRKVPSAKKVSLVHAKIKRKPERTKQARKHAVAPQKQAVAAPKKIVQKSATMLLDKPVKQKVATANAKKNKATKAKVLEAVSAKEKIVAAAEQKPQEVVPEKKQEEKPEPVLAEAEKPLPQEVADLAPQDECPESLEIALGSDACAENGNGDSENFGLSPEVARIYFAVQEELATRWKPPAGLPKDLICTILVRLDREGTVANTEVKKGSGVLIYDLSATNAVQEMQLPQVAWGKEFTISFRL